MAYEIYCNSHFCGTVTIKDKKNIVVLNKKEWEEVGKVMDWKK